MKLDLTSYSANTPDQKMRGPFIERDLSWISFNERVLECALKENRINEAFKFLAITDSNMNEFLSVRFADAFRNKETSTVYKKLLKEIKKFKDKQYEALTKITPRLKKKYDITFVGMKDFTKKEKEEVYSYYFTNVFPLLTPVTGSNISNTTMETGQIGICCVIDENEHDVLSVIPIPNSVKPIFTLGKKAIFIENVIMHYLSDTVFINKKVKSAGVFRIIKDASMMLSHDESRFIIDRMEDTLLQRNTSKPIFMDVLHTVDDDTVDLLSHTFEVPHKHVKQTKFVGYKRFMDSIISDKDASYTKFEPFVYENHENYFSLFDAIKEKDILLHHPYDSYDTVVKFIEHAAIDDDVVAIKQTLYRVSSIDSPIVEALCKAARNGKSVSVLIEIKARFDEQNNINLIEKLERSGATVILGPEYLKTHCKMCIVVRRENNKLKVYSHVASGNYNEKTARQYTDLSYFTSKTKIGIDLLHVFNILSGHSRPDEKLEKIAYSPVTLRKTLIRCIEREIENAKKDKRAEIFMKMNALSDQVMVNKLYEAADAGVKVYIVCRGVCSAVPRKNLYIKSIVGRFLEHSRIYYFANNKNPEYFISSADLLTRNLDKRVEILISLKDSNVIKQLKWMIQVFKEDEKNSFVMDKDGKYLSPKGDFDSHQWFINYSDNMRSKKKWK